MCLVQMLTPVNVALQPVQCSLPHMRAYAACMQAHRSHVWHLLAPASLPAEQATGARCRLQ